MPQLNPAPWFMVLTFSWFVFLTVLPPKIMAHTFPHQPTLQDTQDAKAGSWNWPWH
uniref:ATP synthase complex subunit 8 n=1 Tax=Pseudorhombus dupliciocellatus TaxID=367197 RepID=A0A0X8T035_9PLEU|nr:ATP synthase F0 subunit 8 [Pseudorhombus dupliciocellatus]AID59789.1 ATP synthase F0 subunit 8 [Pseudorhombus dupliciocellatus]